MPDQSRRIQYLRKRGIYLFPNLVTTGAMFAGFYGIIASIHGQYATAGMSIFVAQLLDGLDGRVARLTSTETKFGKEYDSLSDMVAFGLAPAIVVYQWGAARLAEFGWLPGKLGWLSAFVYAVAAALRLARFNAMPRSVDQTYFEGLPSPPAAAMVASMVWLGTDLGWTGYSTLVAGFLITTAAGLLMVSRLAYYSFKEISSSGRVPFTYVLLIPLTFVLIALNPPLVLFFLATTYALSGPAMALWRMHRRRSRRARRGDAGGAD